MTTDQSQWFDPFIDQLDHHIANYQDLLIKYHSLFTYFVLGYFLYKYRENSEQKLTFCNMSQNHLSFTVDGGPKPLFYYVTNETSTQSYDGIFKSIAPNRKSENENDCKIRGEFHLLLFCVGSLNSGSKRRLEQSCNLHPPIRSEEKYDFETIKQETFNQTETEVEKRAKRAMSVITSFLRTNPSLHTLNVNSHFLPMILGYFLAYNDGNFVHSVGTKRFDLGHVILVTAEKETHPIEYTSLLLFHTNNTKGGNLDSGSAFQDQTTETQLVQIVIDIENGLNVTKLTSVETSIKYSLAKSLVEYLAGDRVDKMLVNLSELFKRLYQSTSERTSDINFFIGYFSAWYISSSNSDLRMGWFKNTDGTLFLGIFTRIHVKSARTCLLIKSDIFESRNHRTLEGNLKNLNSCYVASLSKQKMCDKGGKLCDFVPRITQVWSEKISLHLLLRMGNLENIFSYNYNESTVKNFVRLVNQTNTRNLFETLEKFVQFATGFLTYHHKADLLQKNVIKVTTENQRTNFLVFRDSNTRQTLDVTTFISEICTKTDVTILIEIDTETGSLEINEQDSLAKHTEKYCTKQKTTMKFVKQNGSFVMQQAGHSTSNPLAIQASLLSEKHVANLADNLQALSLIWTMDRIVMTRKTSSNESSGEFLLDPMSHQVHLLKSSQIKQGNRIRVTVEPRGRSSRFRDYEFIASLQDIQEMSLLCPAKLWYTGRFFRNHFAEHTMLIRKFTPHTIEWFGLAYYNAKWQGFCTSYDFGGDSSHDKHVFLSQIADCKYFTVLTDAEEALKKQHSLCTISNKTVSKMMNTLDTTFGKSPRLIVDVEMKSDVDISNRYLSASMTYVIFHGRFFRFTLLTPQIQAEKINHQTMLLDISLDDIVSIRYSTVGNTKVIDLRTMQYFFITISIDNHRNNFAFHVIKTKDNYLIVVHPISKIFLKSFSKYPLETQKQSDPVQNDNVLKVLAKNFTLITTQPENVLSIHLSNNELQKVGTSRVINWVKNDANLITSLVTKTDNWILELDADCSTDFQALLCRMKTVNVEADSFYSAGTKLVSLKALCWKLKEYQHELTVEIVSIKHNSVIILLFSKSIQTLKTVFIGKIKLMTSSNLTPLTKVYLEFEYIHVLQTGLDESWTLTPYKLNLPRNVRWLVLKPESLVRPVAYKMRCCAVTNFEFVRIHNSIVFKISIVLDEHSHHDNIDYLYVLCYSFFDVTHAFPKIVIEFTNEVYFIMKPTLFRTFS